MKKSINNYYLKYDEFMKYQKYNDGGFLQYVLGIQSCKSKGDVVELLKEIYEHGRMCGLHELSQSIIKVTK
jgi:hypothetical protein